MSENNQSVQDNQEQQQLFDRDLHRAVIELLNKFENQKQLKVVFASETGSRGQGFHTSQSDCDIKGFYTYSQAQYLGVADLPESYLSEKFLINVQGKEIEVDFSFIEFRYYIEQRLCQGYEKLNTVFTSKVQYINLFEKQMFDQFVYHTLETPKKAFYSDLETFITRRINQQDVECRKILNTLHCLVSLIHFINSDKLFQYSYDLWEEIEINPYLDQDLKVKIKDFAKLCLEKKIFSRKSTIKRNSLPVWFMNLLSQYNIQKDSSLIVYEKQQFLQMAQQMHVYAMNLQ
ncbi:nucleotidyltransferase (macronuclear) [Tetrahymena thermophila SB210]|uniref:Nucleotidyltransferase n=1 Tax=Tetrahymena thermophila (strain SB210) TaxID=312017 RepID=I7M322_TETTS|nr:nucleotidyltransferase [Tetrahymena thermophila SB210]EAS01998.1 nucleotidyltransferase [Tetrahymena thermophila SB210]|eukprot:XP_001022243.1 nucleotidyltransferase [Tetrahymena thermophila SB210]